MEKPAIVGGKPAREEYLIFGKPDIGKEEIDGVIKVLKSGWLSTGPKVKELEEEFAKYIGCKHAIALNSCTSALHLSLLCSGVLPGDEVIVPSMTFAATVNVIEHVGAIPVFADIQEDTYNIDPSKITELITKKTKAIIPVHFGGLPCDIDEINSIADEHNLVVIEDAAHAVGAEYKSNKIGSGPNIAAFSFYATKNMTSGEGGMLTTNDDELSEKIRIYSLHGLSKHAWERFSKGGKKTYEVICPGYKYNMQDLNAAIALCQLKKLDLFNSIRAKYAQIYLKEFEEESDFIHLPPGSTNTKKSSWHLFPILLKLEKLSISKEMFITALEKENIGTGVHYHAIHLQPYYQKKYKIRKPLNRTCYVSERTVSLPLQTSMSEDDVYTVIDAVKKILHYYKK